MILRSQLLVLVVLLAVLSIPFVLSSPLSLLGWADRNNGLARRIYLIAREPLTDTANAPSSTSSSSTSVLILERQYTELSRPTGTSTNPHIVTAQTTNTASYVPVTIPTARASSVPTDTELSNCTPRPTLAVELRS